jgi:hypothetical protein
MPIGPAPSPPAQITRVKRHRRHYCLVPFSLPRRSHGQGCSLRLAGLLVRDAPASCLTAVQPGLLSGRSQQCCSPCTRPARRVRGVTLTATLRHPASLRPSRAIHISAFDRFDEILYLVENAADLTLTDFVRCHVREAIENARADYISNGRASPKLLSRPLLFALEVTVAIS